MAEPNLNVEPKFDREELLKLCDASIVPQDKWRHPDTWRRMGQIGELTTLLEAGCDFKVLYQTGPGRRADMYQVVVWFRGIPWFNDGDERSLTRHEYFLPRWTLLDKLAGKDWF